jgi:2-dehydro-3-deoxy-D-arabinonate dehydratase|tara:strand:+ start:270 stop:1109 length:840 start_codon:yes stop_codon:yes gene_type:complete
VIYLYNTLKGLFFENDLGVFKTQEQDLDKLLCSTDLYFKLKKSTDQLKPEANSIRRLNLSLLPPIKSQEVWASGVTYFQSKTARMEEAKTAGGADFYDRVYEAERPELFFKSTPNRVRGTKSKLRIRKDSAWNVPEPELTLVVSPNKKIIGYTIGNDMSSRSIEGENPLYLPQAKSYTGSTSLGPCILLTENPISAKTKIQMKIFRSGKEVFDGKTEVGQIKRSFSSLVDYLYREMDFPMGCFLMTGTGIIPPDNFTLHSGDKIEIKIKGIGLLENSVE